MPQAEDKGLPTNRRNERRSVIQGCSRSLFVRSGPAPVSPDSCALSRAAPPQGPASFLFPVASTSASRQRLHHIGNSLPEAGLNLPGPCLLGSGPSYYTRAAGSRHTTAGTWCHRDTASKRSKQEKASIISNPPSQPCRRLLFLVQGNIDRYWAGPPRSHAPFSQLPSAQHPPLHLLPQPKRLPRDLSRAP